MNKNDVPKITFSSMPKQAEKKKTVKNKLQLIDDLMHKQGNKTITIGVDEFKALFSTAQLNRGWTKPQIEDFLERCK
tara:strand:- start:407 stop:637 length:231 start_codon:yes stop_codon:yes gene_type:complete